MTDRQIEDMRRMRREGKSLQEIADEFKISNAYVSGLVRGTVPQRPVKRKSYERRCHAYQNINAWMRKNNISQERFAELLDVSIGTVFNMLNGNNVRKDVIDKTLRVTGMRYEYAFRRTFDNET